MPPKIYVILRSARRARLEGRTSPLQPFLFQSPAAPGTFVLAFCGCGRDLLPRNWRDGTRRASERHRARSRRCRGGAAGSPCPGAPASGGAWRGGRPGAARPRADRGARPRLDGDLCRGAAADPAMGVAPRRGRRARRSRDADPGGRRSANTWRSWPAASRCRRARSSGRTISAWPRKRSRRCAAATPAASWRVSARRAPGWRRCSRTARRRRSAGSRSATRPST